MPEDYGEKRKSWIEEIRKPDYLAIHNFFEEYETREGERLEEAIAKNKVEKPWEEMFYAKTEGIKKRLLVGLHIFNGKETLSKNSEEKIRFLSQEKENLRAVSVEISELLNLIDCVAEDSEQKNTDFTLERKAVEEKWHELQGATRQLETGLSRN